MIVFIRATLRLLFFAIGSLFYILRILGKELLFGHDQDRNLRLRRQWFYIITKTMGVSIETFGNIPDQSGLLVCSHRSYFDPIIIMAKLLAFPVGKAEMKDWPIIGWGAKVSGVVFVDRKNPEGRRKARKEILEKLRQGYFVINFPEGTTHIDAKTRRFKPGMFKDAATEGFRIYPVALDYQRDSDAFVGTDTFLSHFYQCFGQKLTRIRISYGPVLQSDDFDFLRTESKAWIDAKLLELRAGWHCSEQQKT